MDAWNKWRRIKKIALYGLLGLLTVLSGVMNRLFTGDVYPYLSETRTVGLEAFDRSQGVTTDGTAWIFSGKDVLSKVTFDDKTVLARNKNAIPDELRETYGSAHIGGISYAGGYVYAAIEDSGVWQNPIVALFNGETLDYTGIFALLPGKDSEAENAMTHGVPWVCCDVQRGVFYAAQCDDADCLFVYDLYTFEYLRSIPLSEPVDEIQGAEMWNGRLYAATNDATRAVYQISVKTGEVTKYFDRIQYQPRLIDNFGGEGEDITVLPMADGSVFHALNIGALFVDANLRHYEPVDPALPPETDDTEPHVRPNVTYLDKYLVEILDTHSYTMQMQFVRNGYRVPITICEDGDRMAFSFNLLSASGTSYNPITTLGNVRLITLDRSTEPKTYIALKTGYARIDTEDGLSQTEEMISWSALPLFDTLEYVGLQSYAGYSVESWRDADAQQLYRFYFDSSGLVRMDVISEAAARLTETVLMQVTPGLDDPDIFALKGIEYPYEEFLASLDK